MKQYPSIDNKIRGKGRFYIFEKLDGSNIRAEWHPKKGFWKFGSRHCLIDRMHEELGEAVDLIKEKEHIFRDIVAREKWESAVAFFEFWGENSFAGLHGREKHYCSLIDVAPHRKGILRPQKFIELFGVGGLTGDMNVPVHMDTVNCLDCTNITDELVVAIREGKFMEHQLSGQRLFEGVVCKQAPAKPSQPVVMFKIKSHAWLDAVKARYKDDPKKLKELL